MTAGASGLLLAGSSRQDMVRHAEGAFPEECCGAMLGRDRKDGVREVVRVLPFANEVADNRLRRYLVEPVALMRAERTARGEGLDVVGIYHSHPNHPSRPSEFDREHALPHWSYLILSVMDGRFAQLESWRLREDRSAFDPETVSS
jgi:proteasome lid subunit RPN8/RPN11